MANTIDLTKGSNQCLNQPKTLQASENGREHKEGGGEGGQGRTSGSLRMVMKPKPLQMVVALWHTTLVEMTCPEGEAEKKGREGGREGRKEGDECVHVTIR